MRRLWLLPVVLLFLSSCTDPNVSGQIDPRTDMATPAQTSSSPTEELVMTTPLATAPIPSFQEIEEIETPVPVFTATPGPSMSFNYAYSDRINVHYYDMENDKPMTTPYPVSDKTDPQVVLDGVKSAYAEILEGQNIQINDATFSGGNLFVDFAPSIYQLNVGSAGERQILDSIADTYLTNVDGIEAVYYTVDGEPYNSDNLSLAENESYKTVLDQS